MAEFMLSVALTHERNTVTDFIAENLHVGSVNYLALVALPDIPSE